MSKKISTINYFYNMLVDGDIDIDTVIIEPISTEDTSDIELDQLLRLLAVAYYIYQVDHEFDLKKYLESQL